MGRGSRRGGLWRFRFRFLDHHRLWWRLDDLADELRRRKRRRWREFILEVDLDMFLGWGCVHFDAAPLKHQIAQRLDVKDEGDNANDNDDQDVSADRNTNGLPGVITLGRIIIDVRRLRLRDGEHVY